MTALAYHDALLGAERPSAARAAVAAPPEPFVPSRYAETRSRPIIVLVVALHALALFALMALDVVPTPKRLRERLAVTMVALDPPPPPHAPPKAAPPPPLAVVAPPPIVPMLAAPPPPPIAIAPPPPAPVVAPAPPAPAAPPGPPAPIGAADLMADVIAGDPPRYPTESRRLRESGTVRLRLAISPAGRVEEIAIAQSSGYDRLDQAALAAVRKWRFRPSMRGGEAIGAMGYLPITFSLPH